MAINNLIHKSMPALKKLTAQQNWFFEHQPRND